MRARHILLEFKAPWPVSRQRIARTRDEARALAEQLIDRVLAGEDFGALAMQYSGCPSRQGGGDLGRFGPDDMAKRFNDAMRTLEVNQLSDPVETEFGWHVIWRTE
jgi:parvulin-like peptidyl-prolyl isomerase